MALFGLMRRRVLRRARQAMVDLRLYALLDPERAGDATLGSLAQAAADGGATLVQLRDKLGSTRRLVAQVRGLKAVLAPRSIPLLVNDRVDVALAAAADGVHVGQEDMEAQDARRLLGPGAIIGLSIKTVAQAQAAPVEVVDYVCIGGVFATASKHNPEPPVGIDGLRTILTVIRRRAPRLPVGAIAGIDATNAAAVMAAGADGIAVISALSLAADVVASARTLRGIVDAGLRTRR
jgi:thiamine-phosphate pyrophosphorylase